MLAAPTSAFTALMQANLIAGRQLTVEQYQQAANLIFTAARLHVAQTPFAEPFDEYVRNTLPTFVSGAVAAAAQALANASAATGQPKGPGN